MIRAIFDTPSDTTHVSLLYANQTEDDILCRDTLEALAAKHPDRLKIWYTLDRPPAGPWTYSTGYVTADMLSAHLPAADEATLIAMCGPPPMIAASRALLTQLGHTDTRQLAF